MNPHYLAKVGVALCFLSLPAIAQDGGADNPNGQAPGVDLSAPTSLSLDSGDTAFDIRNIQFTAEIDRDTYDAGVKKGSVPIRLTIANHGSDAVSFSSAATAAGQCVEIYAKDETYHKKLIFPTAKSSKDKPAMIEVAAGKTVSVLVTPPLPAKLLNPKYKGYLVTVHVYVPRLEHTFEVDSAPFAIPPAKGELELRDMGMPDH